MLMKNEYFLQVIIRVNCGCPLAPTGSPSVRDTLIYSHRMFILSNRQPLADINTAPMSLVGSGFCLFHFL